MNDYKTIKSGFFIILGLLLSSFVFSTDGRDKSSVLQPSYDVLLGNVVGAEINLNSLQGKVVVLNYWAKWCLPCLAEMPALNQLYEEFADNEHIIFMTIDMDGDVRKAEKFMKKRKFTLPVYQVNSELPLDLRSRSIPTTIILDKKGIIVNKHVGVMNFKSVKFKEALRQLSAE